MLATVVHVGTSSIELVMSGSERGNSQRKNSNLKSKTENDKNSYTKRRVAVAIYLSIFTTAMIILVNDILLGLLLGIFFGTISGGFFAMKFGHHLPGDLKTEKHDTDSVASDESPDTNTGSERVCPDCGWNNPHNNSYCYECGAELEDEEATTGRTS